MNWDQTLGYFVGQRPQPGCRVQPQAVKPACASDNLISEINSTCVNGVFPTRATWQAAAIEPKYTLCQISIPEHSAIAVQVKRQSPAPAGSFGAVLKAGNRSVIHSSEFLAWSRIPSVPSDYQFSACACSRSASATTARPELESRNGSRASLSVGVISFMPRNRDTLLICEEAWLSAPLERHGGYRAQ